MLRSAAAAATFGPLFKLTEGTVSAQARSRPPNKFSAPSDLKITDIRGCTIEGPYDFPTIRIDTNQGVYGLGELFCLQLISEALLLKPFLVGKNPLEIPSILQSIRRFAFQSQSGGYSAIDIALHDLAGKVYGVPAWRLIGDKVRDRVLLYCDTMGVRDPKLYGSQMKRRQEMGFKYFKMDLDRWLVSDKPGATGPEGVLTDRGLKHICELVQAVKDAIGWSAPLSADTHGGGRASTVTASIRFARAVEPYNMWFLQDLIAATDWRRWKQITDSTTTPTLTGESLFGLPEGYKNLIDNHAVGLIHPDVTAVGGMLEVKRVADYAALNGISTVVHCANGPVAQMANAHLAATLTNFQALEHHGVDIPWFDSLVTGVSKPIIEKDGYQTVPDTPGLGVELNEVAVKEHLRHPGYAVPDGYFEPTPMYDKAMLGGHPRAAWPHLDPSGKLVNAMEDEQ
jgi:L-alanine-DL-glutamate epimerase-like enolase superfamily enzyme